MHNDLSDKNFWESFFSDLRICDLNFINSTQLMEVEKKNIDRLNTFLVHDGYFELPPPNWRLPLDSMADCVSKLAKFGLPTPFAFVYDEYWVAYLRLHRLITGILGEGYYRLPDFWVWHVDPTQNQSGWRPHRDKGRRTLNHDGTPNAITIWIPLTDSTPHNGCMYILPADRDPTYNTQEENNWKINYPDIRALPASAGTIFCWNQAVLHWGSRSSLHAKSARISMAFEFQSSSVTPYNKPITKPLEIPTFETRVRLIAKQILQYQHMYPLSPSVKEWASKIVS